MFGSSRAPARTKITASCCAVPAEMEAGEGIQTLPEDLVERIIAMIPFPSIFKARGLSKAWLAKFSSISSQEDEGQKCLAALFQKQVGRWSPNWQTLSPVFIGKDDFLAYSTASQKWGKLPSLSFLPENLVRASLNRFLSRSRLKMEGPLLYGFARSETGMSYELYVANILTRTWKQLPPRPPTGDSNICTNLIIDPSTDSYKVILFCGSAGHHGYVAQTYHSKSDSWTSTEFAVSGDFTVGTSSAASLDGVLFMVSLNHPANLLATNAEEGTSSELRLACDDVLENISVNVLVCKTNWLMMVTKGLYPETLQVLKIDLTSRRLVQLARGPPAELDVGNIIGQPVGTGNCVFFRVEDSCSQVLAYNIDEDKWSCFPVPPATTLDMPYKWIGSSFHPGLSPFLAV